jgi:F0F1-type ATP synthase epsilon subunit
MIEENTDAAKMMEKAKAAKEAYKETHPMMHIKVYSPFKVYFDEEGESISAQNGTGPFDILPRHHNFMTLLIPCEIVIRGRGREQKIRISGGLMHVKADRVTVFLDI